MRIVKYVCSKCGAVYKDEKQPCPKCGGVVVALGHFGSAIKWGDE